MRRVSFPVVLVVLVALVLPGAAAGASRAGGSGDSVVVIAGDVVVPPGETVNDIVVVSGDVTLRGHAEGDVVLVSGDALVSGRIDGDLVTLAGRARLLSRAHVGGDVQYGDKRPLVAGSARVVGDVEKTGWPDAFDLLPFVGAFVLWLALTASTAILGALLILIAPRAADAIRNRSRERIGPVIAIGIAVAICVPLAALIATVTVVGLPLGIAIGLALLPLAAVAYVAAAHALGARIVGAQRSRILVFLAGLAILRALALVPVLGFLVGLAATVFGLGLIGAAIGAARSAPEPARSPGS